MTLLRGANDSKLIEIDKSYRIEIFHFLKYLRSKGFFKKIHIVNMDVIKFQSVFDPYSQRQTHGWLTKIICEQLVVKYIYWNPN